MNVYEKLMEVQSKLKAPKNQYNSFGKYKYRSCEDILEGLKPLLSEFKAILTLSDEIYQMGERFYVKASASFIDIEKGEKIEVSASAREDNTKKGMDLAQVTGSVSSYARKYALNGLFCIDDTKDADFNNEHGKGDNDDDFKVTTQMLIDIAKKKGFTEEQLCKKYKVNEVKFIKANIKNEAYLKFKTLPDK